MLSLRRQAARKRRPGRRIPGEHCWFDGRWADGGGFNTFCPCIGRVGASCNTLLSQGFEWAVCCDDSFGPEGNKDCPLLNLTYYQPHAFCSHHLHALQSLVEMMLRLGWNPQLFLVLHRQFGIKALVHSYVIVLLYHDTILFLKPWTFLDIKLNDASGFYLLCEI